MPAYREHAITQASFAQIDLEMRGLAGARAAAVGAGELAGRPGFTPAEYAVVRRVIHTTADFEFRELLQFHRDPFTAALEALRQGAPIVTDVSMVAAGIETVRAKTWQSPVVVAVQQAGAAPAAPFPKAATAVSPGAALPAATRSARGMRHCACSHPGAIFVVGNAPTALLALCSGIQQGNWHPALVVGAPVGFINVLESKQALAALAVPHILVAGRKGGSAVAAAIANALMIWAWEQPL